MENEVINLSWSREGYWAYFPCALRTYANFHEKFLNETPSICSRKHRQVMIAILFGFWEKLGKVGHQTFLPNAYKIQWRRSTERVNISMNESQAVLLFRVWNPLVTTQACGKPLKVKCQLKIHIFGNVKTVEVTITWFSSEELGITVYFPSNSPLCLHSIRLFKDRCR